MRYDRVHDRSRDRHRRSSASRAWTRRQIDELAATPRAARVRRGATTPLDERARVLARGRAQRLRAERETLAATAVREMGKPHRSGASGDRKVRVGCEYFAEKAAAMLQTQTPVKTSRSAATSRFVRSASLLAIMPWNFPFWQVFRAAAPALMAGQRACCSSTPANTTRCALEIERIFAKPARPTVCFERCVSITMRADALIGDARIAAVTLTGSERAGVAVARAAGEALKKCVLELGGSDPFIVLADARSRARGRDRGQGALSKQRRRAASPPSASSSKSRSTTRFSNASPSRGAAEASAIRWTSDADRSACARRSARYAARDRFERRRAAARAWSLGGTPVDARGLLLRSRPSSPTSSRHARCSTKRCSGRPPPSFARATTSDAVALANASTLRVGRDSMDARRSSARSALAAQIEAGMVFINGMVASDPRLPFGGVKNSGYGRELSHVRHPRVRQFKPSG